MLTNNLCGLLFTYAVIVYLSVGIVIALIAVLVIAATIGLIVIRKRKANESLNYYLTNSSTEARYNKLFQY